MRQSRSFKEYVENNLDNQMWRAIDKIMPPMSRFGGKRAEKKQRIIDRLRQFFERFFGI